MQVENSKANQRAEKLLLLHTVGVELISIPNLENVLTRIVEVAVLITDAEESSLFLLDQNNKKLFLRAAKQVGEKAAKIFHTDITNCMENISIDSKKPIMLNEKDIRCATGYPAAFSLCVPLYSKEESLGALCVFSSRTEGQSLKENEDLLFTLAEFASNAIRNTKLLGDAFQRVETLSGLYNISQSMLTEIDLIKLLGIVADNALNVLDADIVVLYEYLKEKKDVKIPPIYRGNQINTPDRLERRGNTHKESVLFKLLETGKPFYAPDALKDWKRLYPPGRILSDKKDGFIHREKIISSAGIPLCIGNETLGVLFINYRSFNSFGDQQKKRIETFANQATLAIHNSKIFYQRDRYISELTVLNRVIQETSSGVTLSIDAMLNLIYKQTAKLMDVTNFYVAFYDEDSKIVSFEFAVEEGELQKTGQGYWKRREGGNGLPEYVIRTGKALLISSNVDNWIIRKKLDAVDQPIKSWLGVPMMLENKVLGVIVIQNHYTDNAYDEGNRKVLEAIASQAAITIGKVRLFQESQQRLEELDGLYNISQEIISETMNIKSVLRTILERAVQLSDADGGQFLLHDDVTGMIRVRLTHNTDELKRTILRPGEGLCGMVAKEMKGMYTNDYFNSPYKAEKLNRPGFRVLVKGVVAVPLRWQDKLLGVLALTYKPGAKRIFTRRDVDLLNHLAGPASIALAIARYISFQQTMLDNSPDAIIAVDRKGIITQFNKTSERITGIERKSIIGKHVAQFDYDGEKEAKRINSILFEYEEREEHAGNIPTAVRGGSGEYIPILLAGSILRNELGEWIGSIGSMKDLREIEFLDREYRNQQHFLTRLEQYPQDTPIHNQKDLQVRITKMLEMIHEFLYLDYIVLFASIAEDDTVLKAVAWYGLPPAVESGLPHFSWRKAGLMPEGLDRESALRNEIDQINRWLPHGEWINKMISGIRGNNAEFFKSIACGVPVRLADNYRAVLIFGPFKSKPNLLKISDFIRHIARNISINALSWLQALYLRSKHKDSERSIQLMIHRARMLSQQIIGKFSVIKRSVDKESSLKSYAGDGEKLIRNLSHVIGSARTSHIAEMEPEDFDFQPYPLPALIQNCVENFRERANEVGRKIVPDKKIEYLPYSEVDRLMLSVALGNLIDNALKYSFRDTEILINSEYDTGHATIIVEDLGEIMPEKARANLVQPGKRWGMSPRARRAPGTGFGLWDASVIVTAHGGELDFSSVYESEHRANKVKVWITLPLKRDKAPPQEIMNWR